MEFADLESLIATIRTGSFSAAARALGIPKSTVANRVNGLEARLGARLLERTTRQVRPTAEGEMLFRRGEHMLVEVRELERSFRERHGKPYGTLRVSVPVLFEQEFMGRIASAFLTRHPQVGIEVVPDDRRVDIVGEGFDCAIRAGPLDDSSAVARVFVKARNIVVAAASLVARLDWPESTADLARWPVIWHGRETPGRKLWEMMDHGRPVSVEVKPRMVVGSLHAARAAAIEGMGATLLPDFFVDEHLKSGRLVAIAPQWNAPAVPLSIVYPAHKQPSPRLRAFIELLSEQFPGGDLIL